MLNITLLYLNNSKVSTNSDAEATSKKVENNSKYACSKR